MTWSCPRCHRRFRRVKQRHACGLGDTRTLLKERPPELVDLYQTLESYARSLGGVEVVTRNRYALFRTTRIFMDLTVTRDALRVVIHLARPAAAACFVEVGQSGKRVSHVARIQSAASLREITPFVLEAHSLAAGEPD